MTYRTPAVLAIRFCFELAGFKPSIVYKQNAYWGGGHRFVKELLKNLNKY